MRRRLSEPSAERVRESNRGESQKQDLLTLIDPRRPLSEDGAADRPPPAADGLTDGENRGSLNSSSAGEGGNV